MEKSFFIESFPSMFTITAEKDRKGRLKTKTIEIPKGKQSAHWFLKTTITTSRAAELIGVLKGNLTGYLLGYMPLGKERKQKLDKLLKKLYNQKLKGEI